MKKYLLVDEYEDTDEVVVYTKYSVVEAKTPKEAIIQESYNDLFGADKRKYDGLADSGKLQKSTVDVREMSGNETIGDNLIYDILRE
ncbi:hypothetical protein 8014-B2_0052 [Lactobacillus phage ATCC 8014-B2]|uniref:Uncharacterized protein n=1 Tax=Lactobacillus phage ATCC 8014-B2 TaxID=1225795 RepID=K4ID62_9CAUD|nr:hypothetical protein HOQ89_gp094 [Lactobacillus phage ATCC 8014-B2]AFU63119.1 hypothetical protein 8014-B2_0052 [Lactobacillus phage ATCC 8014-B2]